MGAHSHARRVFANVTWSSTHTLRDSLRNVSDLKVAQLEEKKDVDEGVDLKGAKQPGRLILSAV